ncbi:MAG TPA: type II secretion system minor pseudopilin GspJ [Pseudomonas sp.]|nr:type II secretion system minor pseudopilin GspJ [Pseudomonas sp.]
MKRQRAFTLLEVLIAIAIFALLAMATYRMLDSVLQVDQGQRAQEQRLRELTKAMAAFERDLLQVRVRPVRDPLGDPQPALLGDSGRDSHLEFTRGGWRNPLGQSRASLQRVRWQLEGEHWQRLYWPMLDQAQDSQPRVQQALDGVKRFELRFLDDEGRWLQSWPPANSTQEESLTLLPKAVELVIEHRFYGELRRLWRLPEAPEQAPPASEGGGEDGAADPQAEVPVEESAP